jgi:hypothetical protein
MTNTSPLVRIPENTSFLQGTRFSFVFPTLPFLRYFGVATGLPGVSTSSVLVETPFSATHRHGDKLIYEPLKVTAIVDEDVRTWEETYNWLLALTFPESFKQYYHYNDKSRKTTAYHDGTLTFNNNANIPNVRVLFIDCHPISLSGISLDTRSVDSSAMLTCDIVFRYDRFELTRL